MVELRPISRRDLLRVYGVGGLASVLACGGSGGGSGGGESKEFVIDVDEVPFKESNFYSDFGLTSHGHDVLEFRAPKGDTTTLIEIVSPNNGGIGVHFQDDLKGDAFALFVDPNSNYLPTFKRFPSSEVGSNGSSFMASSLAKNLYEIDLNPFDESSKIRGIEGAIKGYITDFRNDLPSFDKAAFGETPDGFVYVGDWSFNDLQNVNNSLKNISLVATVGLPNPFTASAYSFLSTTDAVIDGLGNLADIINNYEESRGRDIIFDRDAERSMYLPARSFSSNQIIENGLLLVSDYLRLRNQAVGIDALYPFEPGSKWEYETSRGDVSVQVEDSLRRIRGEDLIAIDENGVTSFFGYKGDVLNFYGLRFDEHIGDLLFDPPITLGDSNMGVGWKFSGTSKLIAEDFQELLGSINYSIHFDGRGDVELNTPVADYFGDCLRRRINSNIGIENSSNGEVSEISPAFSTTWFAEGVGPIRMDVDQEGLPPYHMELHSYSKGDTSVGALALASSSSRRLDHRVNSISSRIIEGMKDVGLYRR